eukprot:1159432-Pelagomonas_calceolata.AAC.6
MQLAHPRFLMDTSISCMLCDLEVQKAYRDFQVADPSLGAGWSRLVPFFCEPCRDRWQALADAHSSSCVAQYSLVQTKIAHAVYAQTACLLLRQAETKHKSDEAFTSMDPEDSATVMVDLAVVHNRGPWNSLVDLEEQCANSNLYLIQLQGGRSLEWARQQQLLAQGDTHVLDLSLHICQQLGTLPRPGPAGRPSSGPLGGKCLLLRYTCAPAAGHPARPGCSRPHPFSFLKSLWWLLGWQGWLQWSGSCGACSGGRLGKAPVEGGVRLSNRSRCPAAGVPEPHLQASCLHAAVIPVLAVLVCKGKWTP